MDQDFACKSPRSLRSPIHLMLIVVVLPGGLVGSLENTGIPTDDTTSSSGDTQVTITENEMDEAIAWTACPEHLSALGFECAIVETPLDWKRPESEKIELFVYRNRVADARG